MANKIIKVVKRICLAFLIIYGLNLLLASTDIFIPINMITIILVSILGIPGIIGLIAVFLLI